MSGIVAGLGGVSVVFGGCGLVAPRVYAEFAERLGAVRVLWLGAAFRAMLAGVLWSAADDSATPGAFRFLAGLAALGAVFLLVMGAPRIERMIRWGFAPPYRLLRGAGGVGCLLGIFLLWSALAGPGW